MTSVLAFVICDAYDGVLTYDDLRSNGFIGNTLEKEYLSGAHGIDGLINIMGNPPVKDFLEEHEFKVAAVTTPWFQDGRLLTEPAAHIYFAVDDEDEYLLTFVNRDNVTKLFMPGDDEFPEYMEVQAKVSVAMATSTYPILPFDLLGALDPEFVKPVKTKTKAAPAPIPTLVNPIPPPPSPAGQSFTPPPAPQPAPVANPHGALLNGIRNMHKQFEETASKVRGDGKVDSNTPLHKQMFKLF